ncbi:MAG: long-chain fatty acid--CoA ligase [Candidatus Omnitrophica bacterium]|nr:long-chain fatty acid--CoA ligase [Candidatus Omnitrophota bacterium]
MTETIPALFARQARSLAGRTLFLVKREGAYQPITWQQAAEDVTALRTFLLGQQVNPGDRVILFSENRPEWGVADLAIQSVGAWTVPIYPTLTEPDLRTICRDCRPVACVASTSDQATLLVEIGRTLPSIRTIIVIQPTQQHHAHVVAWAEALAQGRELEPKLHDFTEHRMAQLQPDDTATLIYTSGTTGEPKGVMLSHRNFLSNVQASLEVIPITGRDRHLSFLPLCHVFERMAGWYLLLSVGGSIAYAENMDTIPQNMLEVHPTIMLGVPRFFEKLYARIQDSLQQAPPLKRRLAAWALGVGRTRMARQLDGRPLSPVLALQHLLARLLVLRKFHARLGGRLRFFVSGSAPLSRDIAEFFYSAGVTILEGYGLTETSPVIAVNRLPVPRFGSVGQPLPGVEVKIAEDGEILTRGPHIMQGYYQKPEATAAVLEGGWLHTGDIGHLDPAGCLVITDRKKDLIKTAGGKFVAPQKLENLFVSDPHISQAFVFGDKRPYCVALIVPQAERLRRYAGEQGIPGHGLHELVHEPRIIEFYWNLVQDKQRHLAGFEQVKKITLLDQEFSQAAGELTPTLKAKRSIIAQRYAGVLDRLYSS